MRLLVWEFCTGTLQPVDHALMDEGRAMLLAAATDAASCEGVTVTVIGDRSLRDVIPPDCELLTADDPESAQKLFETACRNADAVWLIAPETDGIAADIAATVESFGCRIVGSSASAIRDCSDKLRLTERLAAVGLLGVPALDLHWKLKHTMHWREPSFARSPVGLFPIPVRSCFPLVIKPRFGAGSERTSIIRNEAEWNAAIAEIVAATAAAATSHRDTQPNESAGSAQRSDQLICQPWIQSVPFSAGFVLLDGGRAESVPDRPCRKRLMAFPSVVQALRVDRGIAYHGGEIRLKQDWLSTPVDVRDSALLPRMKTDKSSGRRSPPTQTELQEIGVRLAAAFPGLRGYFGVDLLRTSTRRLRIVDINPRLTTSYLGYRAMVGPEIIRQCLQHELQLLESTPSANAQLASIQQPANPGSIDRDHSGTNASAGTRQEGIRFPAARVTFDKAGRIRHCAADAKSRSQHQST